MTPCTRCDQTGFLNIHQIEDESVLARGVQAVLEWINNEANQPHDVQICDCCGDGTGWHGQPGHHYGPNDPQGPHGPYSYNDGLCECH